MRVERLTPTIVEVIVRAPAAARHFEPGQFFRLQNYESLSPLVGSTGSRLLMEGLALTGAWVDKDEGLLVADRARDGRQLAPAARACSRASRSWSWGRRARRPRSPPGESVVLCGGGLGNAVLFSIAKALREQGNHVLYFAGYRKREDIYKVEEIEAATDQVIWSVDGGDAARSRAARRIAPSWATSCRRCSPTPRGELGETLMPLRDCRRIIAIGSDRMMAAVKEARHGVLAAHFRPGHVAIASINSPMQCMMKEICAQCLQKHVDPATGQETIVFSCSNQDQPQDFVDWKNLAERLRQNTVQEKLTDLWVRRLLAHPEA